MERLKPLTDLLVPDPRFAEIMVADGKYGGPTTYSLEDHYKRYSLLTWPTGAPEEIVSGFVTAQHLAVFSWFVYPFSSVAELPALITLEHDLRRRMSNE